MTVGPRAKHPATFLGMLNCMLHEGEEMMNADLRTNIEKGLRAIMK